MNAGRLTPADGPRSLPLDPTRSKTPAAIEADLAPARRRVSRIHAALKVCDKHTAAARARHLDTARKNLAGAIRRYDEAVGVAERSFSPGTRQHYHAIREAARDALAAAQPGPDGRDWNGYVYAVQRLVRLVEGETQERVERRFEDFYAPAAGSDEAAQ
ncbi:MAG: hypothetical protein ACI9CA_000028 [Natronomonas sp.]|jgi:hypothetical protein